MAKNFIPRRPKRQREQAAPFAQGVGSIQDIFNRSDQRLLEGALIETIKLTDIMVKEQVRTKFNDDSLQELAANIKLNGLIQPLVVHREFGGGLVLICGERRYRAMTRINKMREAPCFILENRSQEELMAIQFSENSSREDLHYVDRADGVLSYQRATGQSERKICQALGISKSEVHRGLLIARLPRTLKEAAKHFAVEKYVLLEVAAVADGEVRKRLEGAICGGEITKRAQFKRALGKTRPRKSPRQQPRSLDAEELLRAIKANPQRLDRRAREVLKELMGEGSK